MLQNLPKEETEIYHVFFCGPLSENSQQDVLGQVSFPYKKEQRFDLLDEVGELADFILRNELKKYPAHWACWTRDISVHQLSYYKCMEKIDCDSRYCAGCPHCEVTGDSIFEVYFFTDKYISNWYFQEHYKFLLS